VLIHFIGIRLRPPFRKARHVLQLSDVGGDAILLADIGIVVPNVLK
jgi:hypothetical protein